MTKFKTQSTISVLFAALLVSSCAIAHENSRVASSQNYLTESTASIEDGSVLEVARELVVDANTPETVLGQTYTQDLTYFMNSCAYVVAETEDSDIVISRGSTYTVANSEILMIDDQISDDFGNPIQNWTFTFDVLSGKRTGDTVKCEFYLHGENNPATIRQQAVGLVSRFLTLQMQN